MTMDPYGHMIDRNLWDAAQRLGGITGRGRTRDRTMRWRLGGKSRLTCHNAWSRLGESNPGPTHYECVALPSELRRLV